MKNLWISIAVMVFIGVAVVTINMTYQHVKLNDSAMDFSNKITETK